MNNVNQKPTIIHAHRYRIEKLLGTGVQGSAYLVEDLKSTRKLDRMKVIKKVPAMNMDFEETVDAKREANFLRKLNHPHVLKLFDSFVEDGYFCMITEFCESGDLDNYLKNVKTSGQKLSESQVVNYITQLIMGIHEIHSKKILHRDIKPSNIFIKSGILKIGDFGISRVLMSTIDRASTFCGAPLFMSPEVLQHSGYSNKADIWSLGVLLYKMCTFRNAFEGHASLMGVLFRVVSSEPEPITDYSDDLCDLCKKMLKKNPDDRPSSVQLLQLPIIENQVKKLSSQNSNEEDNVFVEQNDPNNTLSPSEALKIRKKEAADKRAEEIRIAIKEKCQINSHTNRAIGNTNYSNAFPIEDKLKFFSINNLKDTFDLVDPHTFNKPKTMTSMQCSSQVGVGAEDDMSMAKPSPQRKISDSVYNYTPISKGDDRPIHTTKPRQNSEDPRFSWDPAKEKILADKDLAETYYLRQPDFEEDDEEEEEDSKVEYSRKVASMYETITKEDKNESVTFKDDTIKGAFGVESKEKKITSLREACIESMGKELFKNVYKFIKQKKNRSNLRAVVKDFKASTEQGFLVEQLIFYEEN